MNLAQTATRYQFQARLDELHEISIVLYAEVVAVMSWHNTTKSFGSGGTVNGAVVQRRFMFLSGEIYSKSGLEAMGV